MPDLVIPTLKSTLRAQLRAAAAINCRSVEDEAQRLLAVALAGSPTSSLRGASNDDVSVAQRMEIPPQSNTMRVSGSAQIGLPPTATGAHAIDPQRISSLARRG